MQIYTLVDLHLRKKNQILIYSRIYRPFHRNLSKLVMWPERSTCSLAHLPTSDHHDIMLYRELGPSCVDPATHIYEKIKFESQRPLGFAGHPAIETRCTTAVGSFKFEFSKNFLAESICLKLSFRLHVVAWQPDNGKYVRLKTCGSSQVRV